MDDWKFLNDHYQFRNDKMYAKHKGKPVIAVWGVGFGDNRKYTLDECENLVKFLKTGDYGDNTVMLGVPKFWRDGGGDAVSKDKIPLLHEIILLSDIVSPWTVGRYSDISGAQIYSRIFMKNDLQWCSTNKIELMPVIFPGFSWHNLQASG